MNTVNTCANCGHKIEQNFCPNCGQKKYQRIDGKYIKEEIQYTLLHTNKGFFYTIKNLLKNPGRTTREYLDGNRVKHYKPLLLAFVLSGITTFITYKILNLGQVIEAYLSKNIENQEGAFDATAFNAFSANYLSFFMMLLIPLAAFLSYWVFRKQLHNYYEHIIINSYLYSFWAICTGLVLYPIIYFLKSPEWIVYLTFISMPLFIPFVVWFFKELYPNLGWKKATWKVLLMCFLGIIGYFIFSFILGLIYLAYMVSTQGINVFS